MVLYIFITSLVLPLIICVISDSLNNTVYYNCVLRIFNIDLGIAMSVVS